jgi:hypothetical protein
MKKTHLLARVLTIPILAAVMALAACGKNGDETKTSSAEKNSFKEVTSKLDAGGNLYLYLSTEQWLEGLSKSVAGWGGALDAIPNLKDDDRENVGRVFGVVTNLIQKSGIEAVSGVGMSSIATEKGFYRSKFIMHHYKGKGSGFLWTLFGKSPHALNGLDLLPTTTAFATVSDLDLAMLWSIVTGQIEQSEIPGAKEAMQKLPDNFAKMTGLKLDEVLGSLGGEYGLIVTLDDTRKITFPTGQDQQMEFPEPGILLVIKVKDDTIFNRVDKALKDNAQVIKTETEGVKMRTMPVPLPLPIALRPTIARSGDYLFVATTETLIREVLDVKNGKKPGLKSTDEFKRLARGMPEQGNQFSYVSQKFGQTFQKIQQQVMAKNYQDNQAAADLLKKFMDAKQASFAYSVSVNTAEGWLTVGNGNSDASKLVLLPAVAIPAVLAGVAIPSFTKARETAQRNACINYLREIDGAKHQWALENKKAEQDVPAWQDLKPYLGGKGSAPKCPAGGKYTIGSVDTPPNCSKPGHEMD